MNLLIANDDGYESAGLTILAERLSREHNVYVMGPAGNRSAVSHHITMFSDTEIHKISDRIWSCEGYPADCASIGILSNLFGVKFDGMVSGINYGANLGTDIVYSGTCAGARQAVFNGIPAIALSIDPIDWEKANREGFKFETLADFAANNLETLLSLSRTDKPRTFVNVNASPMDKYNGVKCAQELCVREYHDKLRIVEREGKTFSVFDSGFSTAKKENPLCDYTIVQDGYVSVSVIYADPVCERIVDGIKFKL